ncbi:hypothetical protein HMPREF0591_1790, partial [Mycobacterium parascrofulaceum ATCC BAA-614]
LAESVAAQNRPRALLAAHHIQARQLRERGSGAPASQGPPHRTIERGARDEIDSQRRLDAHRFSFAAAPRG